MTEEKKLPRPLKNNVKSLCGCEKKEVVDKDSGYYIWKVIKKCNKHK